MSGRIRNDFFASFFTARMILPVIIVICVVALAISVLRRRP